MAKTVSDGDTEIIEEPDFHGQKQNCSRCAKRCTLNKTGLCHDCRCNRVCKCGKKFISNENGKEPSHRTFTMCVKCRGGKR